MYMIFLLATFTYVKCELYENHIFMECLVLINNNNNSDLQSKSYFYDPIFVIFL